MLAKIETIGQFAQAVSLMRLGTAGLQLAFVLTAAIAVLAGLAMWRRDERLAHAARRGQYAMLAVTGFCCVLLYVGIFDGYYFVRYIRHVTENNETTPFKVAALWASQQGSLLFWCFILTLFSSAFAFSQRHNRTDRRMPAILLVLAVVQFFFFFIMVSPFDAEAAQRSSPFALEYHWMLSAEWAARTPAEVLQQISMGASYTGNDSVLALIEAMRGKEIAATRFAALHEIVLVRPHDLPPEAQKALLDSVADGNGMNPALHNYWVAIHPPMLYLGFVGFTIPFAWAVGSLIAGEVSEGWLRPIRLWTMGAWIFLTVGIALGGLWAYEILGWGGYWAWDPVENASFIPWLTGTAFIHSVIVTERRGLLRVWSFALIIITYCMTVIGTFLVRSGIINSVHAFGATGNVDQWFYGFLGIVFIGSLLALVWRLPLLKSERRLESLLSREGSFLLNNLVFLAIALVTLVITFWPWITERLYGKDGIVELGQDAFVMVNVPLFLFILVLMGVGPALAWRVNSLRAVLRALALPAIGAAVAFAVNFVWLSLGNLLIDTARGDTVGTLAAKVRLGVQLTLWPICVFTLLCVLREFAAGARARARATREGFFTALARVTIANRRRYGGYIVHVGVLTIALGIYYSSLYEAEGTVTARPGGFGVIRDGLTGRGYVAYYAGESRTASWDFLKRAWGRDEETAGTYSNMLRHVRQNPELGAQDIIRKVTDDMRARNGGELPPFFQQALPRMTEAITWGVNQRDNAAVFEEFQVSLYVFPYDEPADVSLEPLRAAQSRLLAALRQPNRPDEDARLAGILRDAMLAMAASPEAFGENTAMLRRLLTEAKDDEFADALDLSGPAAASALAGREAGLRRVDNVLGALSELARHGMALGAALPAALDSVADAAALLPDTEFAAAMALGAAPDDMARARFDAMQLLGHVHELARLESAHLRNDRVRELARRIDDPEAWSELVKLRPLSLAGLIEAADEAGDLPRRPRIEAEIAAITATATAMRPRMRIFYDKLSGAPRMNEPTKDPYYHRTLARDLYFILQDARQDGTATLRFFVKPHMTLGLAGLVVLVAGTVLAFLPSWRRRRTA
ncbi:MAG: cytochrome c biogenesis protein CcsA [Planctomycetes bacterium]|nr:cytochrome c biogenesis protein CcsA [Planctomycetota bacterium]MCL4730589.1 cytochrome c biogenesis protein CcsA [Planctomycetota bacterium]